MDESGGNINYYEFKTKFNLFSEALPGGAPVSLV